MKKGLLFAKFFPFHKGHLKFILDALEHVDFLHIVVSNQHESNELSSFINYNYCLEEFLIPELRASLVAEELSKIKGLDSRRVSVIGFNEKELNIPAYPDGWERWSSHVKRITNDDFDCIFTNDVEYIKNLQDYFGRQTHILDQDRNCVSISSSRIRQHPMVYFDYICDSFKPFYSERILITGIESVGKSTLCQKLSLLLNTGLSNEYGRHYVESFDKTELSYLDFYKIEQGAELFDYDAIAEGKKYVVFDGDATLTQYYSDLYLDETYSTKTLEERIKNIDSLYDYIFFIDFKDKLFVQDGYRFEDSFEERQEKQHILLSKYLKNSSKVKVIEGDYKTTLNKILSAIGGVKC